MLSSPPSKLRMPRAAKIIHVFSFAWKRPSPATQKRKNKITQAKTEFIAVRSSPHAEASPMIPRKSRFRRSMEPKYLSLELLFALSFRLGYTEFTLY